MQRRIPPAGAHGTANFRSFLAVRLRTLAFERSKAKRRRVSPIEKEELQRIADSEKISLSQAGRTFIRKGMQTRVDMQYSSFLEPVIERVLARYLNNRDSRIISLLVRIAFDSGQTRGIVTNILGLQPDITPDLLRDILEGADRSAKSNIMKKTPQIQELIEALNKWFFETSREENAKK